MKKANTIFWIITLLFSAFIIFTSIPEIRRSPEAVNIMNHLGYPDYFNPFLGVLKVLGVIAILLPGIPRIKEWAYAGLFFDLLGATYSALATDGFMFPILFMIIPFVFWGISYRYYHKRMNILNMTSRKNSKAH